MEIKLGFYSIAFIIVFILSSMGLSYVVLKSKKLSKDDKIVKLLQLWLLPYIGFFIVFFSIADDKKGKSDSAIGEGISSGAFDPTD